MRGNLLKKKLDAGGTVVGICVSSRDPVVANSLSKIGFDFIVFDLEHAPITRADLPTLLMAVEASETEPIVRVPWNDLVIMKQVLDLGVYNLIVPMVNDAQAARDAVAAIKYPPWGIRGCGPWRAGGYGAYYPEYFERANDETAVFVQIEHIDAVNGIDGILSVKGVTGTFVGPLDLSASMGNLPNTQHPDGIEAMERVLEACKQKGAIYGMATGTAEIAKEWRAKGAQLVTVGSDVSFARNGAIAAFEAMQG